MSTETSTGAEMNLAEQGEAEQCEGGIKGDLN